MLFSLDMDCHATWTDRTLVSTPLNYSKVGKIYIKYGKHVYMNVNLVWQFWKDVRIKLLGKLKHAPFWVAFPSLMIIWGTASLIFFMVLRKLERIT
jgi:hypothetical protein